MREFKDILYDKMVKNNFTFQTLAEAIGVGHTAIRDWTSGKSYPNLKNLCAFADVFKCSIDELMGRKPQ
jgi:transcriptional regulator with XRE-family HTH domain